MNPRSASICANSDSLIFRAITLWERLKIALPLTKESILFDLFAGVSLIGDSDFVSIGEATIRVLHLGQKR